MKGSKCNFPLTVLQFQHIVDRVLLLILLLLLSTLINGQTQSSQPHKEDHYSDSRMKVSPSVAIMLVCLIGAFFVMGFASVYVRHCVERRTVPVGGAGSIFSFRGGARGLDPSIVESFPVFRYSDVKGLRAGKATLECAVCINEFEDDETLRLLPKCSHAFHPDCIDAWLAFHVTCPVCRANLIPRHGESKAPETHPSPVIRESPQPEGDLIINIQASPEANVINPSQTPNQNRPPRSTPRRLRITGKFPRSHSTGHSLVQQGEDMERFTLRLPGQIQNHLAKTTSLNQMTNCSAFPRMGSLKKGYRSSSSGGSSRGRGIYYECFDKDGRIDRWWFTLTPPFCPRAGLYRSPVEGDGGREGVATPPRNRFRSVKSPFNRLFGSANDNAGERSFDRLRIGEHVK